LRKGEATRARILAEAGRLASVRGLSAVSLADVAEVVGLSKSGLFKHFDCKEAMQEALLVETGRRFVAFVWAPVEALAPGRARLERIFELWLDWDQFENDPGGCLIQAAAVEFDDQPGPLRDLVHGQLGRWNRRLVLEMQALRDPPLAEAEARLGAFQMNGFVLAHHQSARLLGEADARAAAKAAFAGLLDRMAGPDGAAVGTPSTASRSPSS
jgi:AcrR family transcriptional regulator